MHCAKQGLIKASFCTMVMFPANLGAVPPPCHPLCQPQGGEDSSSASKWMEGVCLCARVCVCAGIWMSEKVSEQMQACLFACVIVTEEVCWRACTYDGWCVFKKKKNCAYTCVCVWVKYTDTHTGREKRRRKVLHLIRSPLHPTPTLQQQRHKKNDSTSLLYLFP